MDWYQREVDRRQQELRREADAVRRARVVDGTHRPSLIARIIAALRRQSPTTADSLTVFHVSSDLRHDHEGHIHADLVQLPGPHTSTCSGVRCAPAE